MTDLEMFDQSRFCVTPKVTDGAGERFKLVGMNTLNVVSQVLVRLEIKIVQNQVQKVNRLIGFLNIAYLKNGEIT